MQRPWGRTMPGEVESREEPSMAGAERMRGDEVRELEEGRWTRAVLGNLEANGLLWLLTFKFTLIKDQAANQLLSHTSHTSSAQ